MYCTYLTIYSGDKLPPFYIGSTSIKKYNNGYCGSISSKKFKKLFYEELKNNPELFDVIILSEHEIRKEATQQELIYQKLNNVVKNPDFINMSFAQPKGYYGFTEKGEKHFNYGRKLSNVHKQKISTSGIGKKRPLRTEKTRINMSNSQKGKKASQITKDKMSLKRKGTNKGENNPMYGKLAVNHGKKEIRISCIYCKSEIGGLSNFNRWHGINCKKHINNSN